MCALSHTHNLSLSQLFLSTPPPLYNSSKVTAAVFARGTSGGSPEARAPARWYLPFVSFLILGGEEGKFWELEIGHMCVYIGSYQNL